MIKHSNYNGRLIDSYEIDGVPSVNMKVVLDCMVPGGWSDYEQVLNSDSDLRFDLNIKSIDGLYLIPVHSVSCWLYSFTIRNMQDEMKERFRVFRRDVEKVLRVTWAMPVDGLVMIKEPYIEYEENGLEFQGATMWDIANIFSSFDLPDSVIEGCDDIGDNPTPLDYIAHIASSTECGVRGYMLSDQIQYVEGLPYATQILESINRRLLKTVPEVTDHLDDYLDALNEVISFETTHFVGEYHA